MKKEEGLTALVFGATGAVGQELVKRLLVSRMWKKVHCVVRKPLSEWQTLYGNEKIEVETVADMDKLFKVEEWKYDSVDAVFCSLGTQTKHGEETFRKVDKTYPLLIADIALRNKIPHYLLVSSTGADINSCFLYMRVKGEVEQELKKKGLNLLSIFQPGLLENRKEARCSEKFLSCLFCCFPCLFAKIESTDAADCLRIVAEKFSTEAANHTNHTNMYDNAQMLYQIEFNSKQ